jgi:hypothetical protein
MATVVTALEGVGVEKTARLRRVVTSPGPGGGLAVPFVRPCLPNRGRGAR